MKPLLTAVFLMTNTLNLIESSQIFPGNTAYGYFEKIGIPEAERIKKIEKEREVESFLRISGGDEAELGEFKYQAGLLVSILNLEDMKGACGGSLVSADRVLTAAHCWYDGINQGYILTVVLGSTALFTGGKRLDTEVVKTHPKWDPVYLINDIAMIYLPEEVKFTANIGPIALPYGRDLCQTFEEYTATATGYGRTSDEESVQQNYTLNKLNLTVISNDECNKVYKDIIQPSNICTGAPYRSNVCSGDSGGPLVTTGKEGEPILIAVTSFGSVLGCQSNQPAGYTRVTSYIFFIQQHIDSVNKE